MIVEIRTYRLKPGTREAFLALMRDEALPMLARHGVHVIDYGASLVSEDGHEEAFLIRGFTSLAERDRQEERFYGGREWREGPRDAVLALIDGYHTIVVEQPDVAIRHWRRADHRREEKGRDQ